jgi:murein DD-endopeptidase MepM/ murein hydrolase activator NlpD
MKLFIPGIRRINAQNGISYIVRSGDTVWDIAKRYGISSRDILRANNLSAAAKIYPGRKLFLPGAKEPDETFYRPLKVRLVVTSRYGYRRHPISRRRIFHQGVDLRARTGTRVYASESGKVIFVGWYGGYGKLVIIKHKGGYTTRYAHLSRIKVPNGRKVKRGDVIGLSGDTGYTTGPNLHFEIRYNGRSVNPMKYVKAS